MAVKEINVLNVTFDRKHVIAIPNKVQCLQSNPDVLTRNSTCGD